MVDSVYSAVRASVDETGRDSRVEVNQRALIDKILARYASAGAVYRELLQNSNDAEATIAEVHFTTEEGIVKQVMYRNNGMPFRDQDWNRLKKIAEGNPSPEKVGAFGVGAYTMFSICEEPLVISGDQALAFFWKGDALWTKTAANVNNKEQAPGGKVWTTFVLPSRDPYPLPSMVEFCQFLCASLTFTKCLHQVRVMVDGEERSFIQKTQIKEPTLVTPPQSSSWWKNDGATTTSSGGTFYLANPQKSIKESIYQIDVLIDGEASSIQARYVSAKANTRISSSMSTRMERVTKKQPPNTVNVEIFLNAGQDEPSSKKKKNKADLVTESFQPQMGKGRIFIGFRTSQTTGLAAHLAAPFVPTVEREAIDLQDPTLKQFNSELLEFSGILMRLSLEHAMSLLEVEWKENAPARERLEKELESQAVEKALEAATSDPTEQVDTEEEGKQKEDNENKSAGLFGFAKFMAKGLKKQIVSVANSVDKILDDGSEYLNPKDYRPLSSEESHAILLMQSFCPEQSTPDPFVGTCLANGFDRCMPGVAPPVLTRSGVIRGDEARLPHQGMETFVQNNVIRKVVYANSTQYHDVIARSCPLTLEDVVKAISDECLDQAKMIFFLKWWTKYSRVDPSGTNAYADAVKQAIRFYAEPQKGPKKSSSDTKTLPIVHLRDIIFFIDKEGLLSDEDLPMPESVMPRYLQEQIGHRTLADNSMKNWFSPIPVEIWLEFISHHHCMTAGRPEDEKLRLKVLSIFSHEYERRVLGEKAVFGGFCRRLLGDKRCIPFDSSEPTQFAAEVPSNLYLYSAELKAFDGVGSFHKASKSLKSADVSEDFLVELGVRKSIAIEFLFQNLETLKWSKDPKPLVEYLRSASLTNKDWNMLKQTQYLPSENDESRTFAPSELFLPDPDLRIFPFVRLLQWPSEDGLSPSSPNGKFLTSLGCHVRPSLETILHYTSERVNDDKIRIQCLDFLCKRMGPQGVYQHDYSQLGPSRKADFRIIPCTRQNFLQNSERSEICSPVKCYSDRACSVMCYPIIDPDLDSRELYATMFQLSRAPPPDAVLEQLVVLIQMAKKMLESVDGKNLGTRKELSDRVIASFSGIFQYLSSRTSEFHKSSLDSLRSVAFIPVGSGETGLLDWYKPEQVFFKSSNTDTSERDSLTELLFKAVDYSSFLSAVGVKEEASARDLFLLLLSSPESILDTLGEKGYRMLLRRIAANPPFTRVSAQIKSSRFLLAYSSAGGGRSDASTEGTNFQLAKAEDIYIIDNSFFGRMFQVLKAPHESDLEDFYKVIGSKFISNAIGKRFEIVGRAVRNSDLVSALMERIYQRSPLLVSPHVTSRPLVPNAASLLDSDRLSLFHADGLLAVFTLERSERRQRTTCCSRPLDRKRNAMYVTSDFDWFDVGYAIGDLILERCQLEDAFFIASLLEAPLEQLRARGFPVDRVLKPEPLPEPSPPPGKPGPEPASSTPSSNSSDVTMTQTVSNGKTATDMKPSLPGKVEPFGVSNNHEQSPQSTDAGRKDDTSVKESDGAFSKEEVMQMMKQMFPDVDDQYLSDRLGSKPTLDDVRVLAEEMSNGNYVRNNAESDKNLMDSHSFEKESKKGKRSFKKTLGRAFGNFRGHSSVSAANESPQIKSASQAQPSSGTQSGPSTNNSADNGPVSPEHDAANHSNMCNMLQKAAGSSAPVNKTGVQSPDTLLTEIPKELHRGTTCEVVPGQNLKPFPGQQGDGRTHNGIPVFSARTSPDSEAFLQTNHGAIEAFSLVLQRLASVYELPLNAIAIFHDPTRGTIAFNANKSLHFNARFFCSLHYSQGKQESYECYSYWFVTFAHELAHNLVTGHNKEHGFYTENYASLYLPKLLALISSLPGND